MDSRERAKAWQREEEVRGLEVFREVMEDWRAESDMASYSASREFTGAEGTTIRIMLE